VGDRRAVIFPIVDARNLQGVDVQLPAAFEGEQNVVVLVDTEGRVGWSGKGGFDHIVATDLEQALQTHRTA